MFFQQLIEMNSYCVVNRTEGLWKVSPKFLFGWLVSVWLVFLFVCFGGFCLFCWVFNETKIKCDITVRCMCQEAKWVKKTIDL